MKKSVPLFIGRLLFHGTIFLFRIAYILFWQVLEFYEHLLHVCSKDAGKKKPKYYHFDSSGAPYYAPQRDQSIPANQLNHDPSEPEYWS